MFSHRSHKVFFERFDKQILLAVGDTIAYMEDYGLSGKRQITPCLSSKVDMIDRDIPSRYSLANGLVDAFFFETIRGHFLDDSLYPVIGKNASNLPFKRSGLFRIHLAL